MRYPHIDELKRADQLCNLDGLCVGGPIHGECYSFGSLPMQAIIDLLDNRNKPAGYARVFHHRLGSHRKYSLALVRSEGLFYPVWLHDDAPIGSVSVKFTFEAALDIRAQKFAPKPNLLEQAPFEPGDRVVINGAIRPRVIVVDQCIRRDGRWWFTEVGDVLQHEAACYVKEELAKSVAYFDDVGDDEVDDPHKLSDEELHKELADVLQTEHPVLTDDQLFGPSALFNKQNDTYAGLNIFGRAATAPTTAANKHVAPFHVGQVVRRRSTGAVHVVEAIKYIDAEKCWAIRIPGHPKPYNAAMFEAAPSAVGFAVGAPQADEPKPLEQRPRRTIIRRGKPQ